MGEKCHDVDPFDVNTNASTHPPFTIPTFGLVLSKVNPIGPTVGVMDVVGVARGVGVRTGTLARATVGMAVGMSVGVAVGGTLVGLTVGEGEDFTACFCIDCTVTEMPMRKTTNIPSPISRK